MPLKIIEHNSEDYKKMVELRDAILRKPLGLSFTEEELAAEKDDILIGCFEDDKLEACCFLTEVAPGVVRLRQMAVLSGFQGKGIGRAMMLFAENVARDRGYEKITMHAREEAVGFYKKLHYKVVSKPFTELGIPHYIMEKDLIDTAGMA